MFFLSVRCERGVNFSISPWFLKFLNDETLTWNDLDDYFKDLEDISAIYFHIERTVRRERPSPSRSARLDQAETATDHMFFLLSRVQALRDDPDTELSAAIFGQLMRQRCAAESLPGICDTLFLVTCVDAGRQIHETLFNVLVKEKCSSDPTDEEAETIFEESVRIVEDFQLVLSLALDPPTSMIPCTQGRGSEEPLNFSVKSSSKRSSWKSTENIHLPDSDPKSGQSDLRKCPQMSGHGNLGKLESRTKTGLNAFAIGPSTPDSLPQPAPHTLVKPLLPTSPQPNLTVFEKLLAQYNSSPQALHFGPDLLLSLLLVEYRRAGESNIRRATNQAHNYASAALKFLDCIGVRKQPVYVFVVNGNRGALSMGMLNEPKPGSKVCFLFSTHAVIDLTMP